MTLDERKYWYCDKYRDCVYSVRLLAPYRHDVTLPFSCDVAGDVVTEDGNARAPDLYLDEFDAAQELMQHLYRSLVAQERLRTNTEQKIRDSLDALERTNRLILDLRVDRGWVKDVTRTSQETDA